MGHRAKIPLIYQILILVETYGTSRMRAAELKVLILASGLFGRATIGIEIDVPDLE